MSSDLLRALQIDQIKTVIRLGRVADRSNTGYEELGTYLTGLTTFQRAELMGIIQIGRGIESFSAKTWSAIVEQQGPSAHYPNSILEKGDVSQHLTKGATIMQIHLD